MRSRRLLALLNYLYLLLVMFAIVGILTAAMTLQYANGELPCPLCLLDASQCWECALASC
jgi:disulfide bond formation protein DsbB